MKLLLLILIGFFANAARCQDSTTAVYINQVVEKAESRTANDIVETKDTSIYDEGDTLQSGPALTVHTEFFTDPQTMLLDKIVEKSLYRKTSTELTIYFLGNEPIRFTNRQWEGSTLRFDFDIYYMNGNAVYVVKRNQFKGSPDGDECLKWCRELKDEYLEIVREYNQTFARHKAAGHGKLK